MIATQGSPNAQRIAFATSEGNGFARWTELAVYYDPTPEKKRRPWIAVSRGCSSNRGETTREESIQVGSLDRALKLFDDRSQLGRSVIAQAEDWQARVGDAVQSWAAGDGFTGTDQEEALRWLYGDELDRVKAQTLIARDFGAGESTVRAALAAGREIKVPLLSAVRFLDRERFRRARENAGG